MRGVTISIAVLSLWSASAGARDAVSAAPPPVLQLRRSEPAVVEATAKSNPLVPAARWPKRGPVQPAIARSQPEQRPAPQSLRVSDAPEFVPGDTTRGSSVSDSEVDSAAFDMPAATAPAKTKANLDFLRGSASPSATPGGPLRLNAFNDFGKQKYTITKGDGQFKLNDVASKAVRPLLPPKRHRPLPITEISIAVMALLSFILGRSLVRSIRRRRVGYTPLA